MNRYEPQPIRHVFPDIGQIEQAENELAEHAAASESKSWGYFPVDMPKSKDVLPAAALFEAANPVLAVGDKVLPFSWMRLSLQEQKALQPLHLDGDAGAGFTKAVDRNRHIWRAVLNLSAEYPRKFGFSTTNPWGLPLVLERGYLHLKDTELINGIQQITIPPREGKLAHGIIACVSQLLHTGIDSRGGHFLASYACELPDSVRV